MRPTSVGTFLVAALLLSAPATTSYAQATDQEHDAHHPEESEATAGTQASGTAAAPPAGMGQGMPGMMGPDMMRMMQMMQQQGDAGRPDAMMLGAMMPGAMMGGPMMGGAPMGPAMGMMGDHGLLYGMPDTREEMTPERVRIFLERRLAWHGNPRLKLGDIATAGDGSIVAEIVTVDGSLVQKLAFNRYPGLFRQVR